MSVIGAGSAGPEVLEAAREVGRLLAGRGLGVVCGGLGGVMEAAARGCSQAGGLAVGILPAAQAEAANPWCRVVIPTGLGQARNALVVLAGEGAIAVAGGAGTLSEIGHALKANRPVGGLGSWRVAGVRRATGPAEAVELLCGLLQ
jgi:hypothetical protein